MRLIDADLLEPDADYDDGEFWAVSTGQIQDAPTIEPEREKGEWIGADSQCGIGCPFCGTPVDDFCTSIDYIDLRYEPNFCPNCGADMRGAERREE